jgi:hypothetical protein
VLHYIIVRDIKIYIITLVSPRSMQMNMDPQSEHLPGYFNAVEKWPGKIHEPLDQGNCAASWAFSTACGCHDSDVMRIMII